MVEMLYYNEICAATRRLVQSSVTLSADGGGSDTVTVGSNRLFAVGNAVVLRDDQGQSEEHTVAELIGLTQVRLDSVVTGEFLVTKGAILQHNPVLLPQLKWVGQGLAQIIPQPPETQLPAVIVQPARLDQPLTEGTNRAYQQDYHCLVYYLQRPTPGEAGSVELMGQAAVLFNLLMQDPYLGGSAWYAQVVRVEPEAGPLRRLREAGLQVVGVEMEIVARRLATIE